MKNHVVIHFKDQLLCDLPTSLPFTCPECKYVPREKITLLRHYAFSHRKVFDFASEEDFKARPDENKPESRNENDDEIINDNVMEVKSLVPETDFEDKN